MSELKGKTIAILATDGFEEVELTKPRKALDEAGATTYVVAPQSGTIKAWDETDWSEEYKVDITLEEANANEFDNLLLPGGVINPDKLRLNKKAVQFVASFLHAGKPIAAICHAPQLLIETGEMNNPEASHRGINTDEGTQK
jgi:protease I